MVTKCSSTYERIKKIGIYSHIQNLVNNPRGLFSYKKWSTGKCYNMDEPWKKYA